MLDINNIKPKVKGESDKYSWNLYQFLHKIFTHKEEGEYHQRQLEVHWLHYSRWDGCHLEFDENNLLPLQVLILPLGKDRGSSFYALNTILAKGKPERFALPKVYRENTTDITEWFFNTYERDGRCIFDREHNGWLLGAEDRFTYVNNTRRCNWCGKWQQKEIHTKKIVKREIAWV